MSNQKHPSQKAYKGADKLGVHWSWLRDRRRKGDFIKGIQGYCYNAELCAHWIDVGGDPVLHQKAIDEYSATTG
ncbi:MAG: hypothetical protein RMI89_03860 [Gloeomargarita sp. SKYBB_i_bin120]|nr:hypothetical protein [Gloeomargarita sp. SKYG98]MCS7292093.1 hypothetical protein [Gloeomargarita sp. SKYB120]MDW8177653.1 hypothetical protein [Gloeomargarita sp. SKYBB_i_bin120]